MDDYEVLMNLGPPVEQVKAALSRSELRAEAAKVDPDPTAAQKDAGNYQKGHITWKGLPITIETAAGSTRNGVGKDGEPWSVRLKDHYGYFKRTESEADGDHVDVFVSGDPDLCSEIVFVVNQVDPDTGKFDEHKLVVGTVSEDDARRVYLRNYAKGWRGLGSVSALTLAQLRRWLKHGDTAKPLHGAMLVKRALVAKTGFDEYVPHLVPEKRADDGHPFTIAVDLDGTLAEKEEPFDAESIGDPRDGAVAWVRKFKDAGARIIINTVRGDVDLVETWCADNAVPYDHVNENPDQPPDSSGKVYADVYWDDRAYNAVDPDEHGPEILELIGGAA